EPGELAQVATLVRGRSLGASQSPDHSASASGRDGVDPPWAGETRRLPLKVGSGGQKARSNTTFRAGGRKVATRAPSQVAREPRIYCVCSIRWVFSASLIAQPRRSMSCAA